MRRFRNSSDGSLGSPIAHPLTAELFQPFGRAYIPASYKALRGAPAIARPEPDAMFRCRETSHRRGPWMYTSMNMRLRSGTAFFGLDRTRLVFVVAPGRSEEGCTLPDFPAMCAFIVQPRCCFIINPGIWFSRPVPVDSGTTLVSQWYDVPRRDGNPGYGEDKVDGHVRFTLPGTIAAEP